MDTLVRILVLVCLTWVYLVGLAYAEPSEKLIKAIHMQESSGGKKMIGDGGASQGHFHIQAAVITDVNRAYGTKYTLKDRYNLTKSKDILKKYLQLYGKCYQSKTGKKPNDEVYARCWNGGPQGWNPKYKAKFKATTKYWKDIKKWLI